MLDTHVGALTTLTVFLRFWDGSERLLEHFLVTGHGGPAHDPAERLRLLIHHRERREQELLDALAGGASTPRELREKIYVGLPEVRQDIAERQVVTGLAKLMEEGRAKQDGDHYTLI